MRVLTGEQMREADKTAIHEIGIPSIVLMENAGRQVVAAMEAFLDETEPWRIGVLAGRGSNGGDGFVVARTLAQRGAEVLVFVVGQVSGIQGDARVNLEILGRLGLDVVEIANEQDWELHSSALWSCTAIVDAMFGTGLRSPLAGVFQTIVADINESDVRVVAIDVPSGVSCETPELIGDAIEATVTIALGAPKIPHLLPPAERLSGDLVVADIGIPPAVVDGVPGVRIEVVTRESIRSAVTPRDPQAHKGDFGRVTIVAGSVGKTGAAHLAGLAALRSGAGLVTIATPRVCQAVVSAMAPEYMTLGLDGDDGDGAERAVSAVLDTPCDVIAIGPGLGVGAWQRDLLAGLVGRSGVPVVLDADALNLCAASPSILTRHDNEALVLTPHPGEMARLLGTTTDDVQARRLEVARTFASDHRAHVVLKGYRTLVASPEGRVSINMTGNPGMATGGTGDVLTGVIAAWIAQLLDPDVAARLGVYLHGLAGDLAEADLGAVGMTASDVVEHLPDAFLELTQQRQPSDGASRDGERRR
ncbi:MAG: NAD(P)H-hydrate dehydratase [Vicinamibacterales bacterium]